ncbi:hypothetical protein [Pseudomonas sp. ANT_H12B]|uniref:hypothetical protein n=1 Tax=Pseudomonas sp. ANT_H12B TaxID=2597348 RepID=UPI0011EE7F4F|nr:hypothetical protein [Pseudomonas sp. ANT_H12B]KAA0961776.1 hypothetical protein FQ185_25360 [Pseudomonas sp. ANT_H12B]
MEGIDDNDLDGYVPRNILLNGTRIIIPYWPDPKPMDELWIELYQGGTVTRLYTESYSPPQPPFLYFNLTAAHLATDGVALLSYQVWKGGGGISDPSPERKLTIDHTPILVLNEPTFPHATIWGYLNNKTVPPLTSGATVLIPTANSPAADGDTAKLYWQGYSSLNGSGPPVPGTSGDWEITLEPKHMNGHWLFVVPFDPNVRPLIDNASAIAHWQLFKGGRLVGESQKGLVKIDRVTPGESGPSGLNTQGDGNMAIKFVPRTPRPEFNGVKNMDPLAVIDIVTLADGLIAKSVLDTGFVTINFTRTAEEFDEDELELKFGVKGQAQDLWDQKILLGPVAARPVGTIPIQLPASLFPELPTPATPTIYEAMFELYKQAGGVNEPSNDLEFVIDKTAPFGSKRSDNDGNTVVTLVVPTPTPTFVNPPSDAQRTITEAWAADPANANLNFTVNVGYPLRRLDDNLRVWLISGVQRVEAWNAPVPASGAFTIANTVLRTFPNGRVRIQYQWKDLPGNESRESAASDVLTLALAQPPVSTKGPLVPKTDPNYTTALYLDDFAGAITAIVESAFITNAEPGDEIFITIEDATDATNFVDLTSQPWVANTNLTFALTYTDLSRIFNDADEPKMANIWYQIVRPGIPNAESPVQLITLAFDYAGPTNPDLPDLTNPDMVSPVVTGASSTPNDLLPGDRNSPGKFKVTLAIGQPPITSAELAKCYINGQLVGEFNPFVGADEFEVPVSADIISRLPIGIADAHWTIQKADSDKNVMKSPDQQVTVAGAAVPLPPPTIRIRNPALRDYIECYGMISPTSSMVLGLQIQKDPLLPPGKTITARFAAYRDLAGTDLISGTEDSQDYVIKAADVPDVAPVANPAIFKLAQPVRGAIAYGKYWYTTDINGQQSSDPVIKRIDNISNSFNYCDLTPAPAAAT